MTINIFFEKLCLGKRENINVFWKGNKTKDGKKDALYSQAEIDRPPEITLQPEFFLGSPFFISVINGLFKNMSNYRFFNYEILPE